MKKILSAVILVFTATLCYGQPEGKFTGWDTENLYGKVFRFKTSHSTYFEFDRSGNILKRFGEPYMEMHYTGDTRYLLNHFLPMIVTFSAEEEPDENGTLRRYRTEEVDPDSEYERNNINKFTFDNRGRVMIQYFAADDWYYNILFNYFSEEDRFPVSSDVFIDGEYGYSEISYAFDYLDFDRYGNWTQRNVKYGRYIFGDENGDFPEPRYEQMEYTETAEYIYFTEP